MSLVPSTHIWPGFLATYVAAGAIGLATLAPTCAEAADGDASEIPGSVFELVKAIGPLTDPTAYGGRAEDAFDVVIPSMHGYGYSERPRELYAAELRAAFRSLR